jgi:hypothetical protein
MNDNPLPDELYYEPTHSGFAATAQEAEQAAQAIAGVESVRDGAGYAAQTLTKWACQKRMQRKPKTADNAQIEYVWEADYHDPDMGPSYSGTAQIAAKICSKPLRFGRWQHVTCFTKRSYDDVP